MPGITRDTILKIADQLRIPDVETIVPREMLYIADEIFFTGTAAEVTPIRSVDRIVVGARHPRPITERIQRRYFEVVKGEALDEFNWLTRITGVRETEPVGA